MCPRSSPIQYMSQKINWKQGCTVSINLTRESKFLQLNQIIIYSIPLKNETIGLIKFRKSTPRNSPHYIVLLQMFCLITRGPNQNAYSVVGYRLLREYPLIIKRRAFLKKSIVTQQDKTFPIFSKPQSSLPISQKLDLPTKLTGCEGLPSIGLSHDFFLGTYRQKFKRQIYY